MTGYHFVILEKSSGIEKFKILVDLSNNPTVQKYLSLKRLFSLKTISDSEIEFCWDKGFSILDFWTHSIIYHVRSA